MFRMTPKERAEATARSLFARGLADPRYSFGDLRKNFTTELAAAYARVDALEQGLLDIQAMVRGNTHIHVNWNIAHSRLRIADMCDLVLNNL